MVPTGTNQVHHIIIQVFLIGRKTLGVCLGFAYFAATENFLLKIL